MACFLVPAAEAAVAGILTKHLEDRESAAGTESTALHEAKIPMSRKLRWLARLLAGGAVLLAFEHLWHGEIAPWYPFLTAMADPADAAAMAHEMATVGVGMALSVTAVWGAVCAAADAIVRRPDRQEGAAL